MRRGAPLALFWFLYFAGLGVFFPYYSLYLRENAGLTGTQVGLVMAMLPLVGIVAQPLWGHVADRTGARIAVLAWLSFGSGLGYLALTTARGFWGYLLGTAVLSVFATAVVPVSISVTLAAFRDGGPHAFGLIRVWGTLGYLALVVGFPWALHQRQAAHGLAAPAGGPSEPGLKLMFAVIAAFSFAAALVGPFLPREGAVELRAPRGDWRRLLRLGPALRLTLFTLGAYVCLQGPMSLFPLYIRAHGGSMDTVGRMWVLMLLVEIPLVALSGAGLQRIGARGLLAIGVIAGGARWMACGLTGDLRLIYPVQILHGAVVAGLLLGAPLYLEAVVPEELRSTAQALLSAVGFGCGGIASNAAAGWLLQHLGADAPYLAGGVGALGLGAFVAWILPAPVTARRTEDVALMAPAGGGAE